MFDPNEANKLNNWQLSTRPKPVHTFGIAKFFLQKECRWRAQSYVSICLPFSNSLLHISPWFFDRSKEYERNTNWNSFKCTKKTTWSTILARIQPSVNERSYVAILLRIRITREEFPLRYNQSFFRTIFFINPFLFFIFLPFFFPICTYILADRKFDMKTKRRRTNWKSTATTSDGYSKSPKVRNAAVPSSLLTSTSRYCVSR